MTGDAQRRHCPRCDRNVHSLSGLSPERAEHLAAEGICGEYVADADGMPIFTDRTVVSPIVPAIVGVLLLAGCAPHMAEDDLDPIEPSIPAAVPETVVPDVETVESTDATHDIHEGECDDEHKVFTRGVVVSLRDLVIPEVIYFPDGGVAVAAHSKPILDNIAEVLGGNPEIRRVTIVGHSDNTGTEAEDNDAAHDRAEAVRRYLVERGVEAERLATESRGAREPVDSNATEAGRVRNRRVSFEITERVDPVWNGEP